jgi:hypothetical protein
MKHLYFMNCEMCEGEGSGDDGLCSGCLGCGYWYQSDDGMALAADEVESSKELVGLIARRPEVPK